MTGTATEFGTTLAMVEQVMVQVLLRRMQVLVMTSQTYPPTQRQATPQYPAIELGTAVDPHPTHALLISSQIDQGDTKFEQAQVNLLMPEFKGQTEHLFSGRIMLPALQVTGVFVVTLVTTFEIQLQELPEIWRTRLGPQLHDLAVEFQLKGEAQAHIQGLLFPVEQTTELQAIQTYEPPTMIIALLAPQSHIPAAEFQTRPAPH